MHCQIERPQKRLFIALLSLSLFFIGILAYAMWRLTYLGLKEINIYLPTILGGLFTLLFFMIGLGIISMVASVKGIRFFGSLQLKTYALINFLFPIAIMIGKILGIKRRKIESSFIAVSNQIMRHRKLKVPADRLLVVTPHCLQLATCPHKITVDPIGNCKCCGRCDIGALVKMAKEMGFHFFVVTGGTLARQTVKKIRPKVVVAIACERDLASGIQDVYPLPAVGVLNIRPNGPCYNTHVDVDELRREIEKLIIPINSTLSTDKRFHTNIKKITLQNKIPLD